MNKEIQMLLPELRYPEFEKDGYWKNTILGKCLLKHPEYGIGAAAVPYSENLPTYLRITDITVDGKFIKDDKVSVSEKVTEDNYLNEGDIVFARTGASVGKSYKFRIEDGRLVFAGFLIRVKPNNDELNSELLFQFVTTEQYWNWVKFVSARSGQPGINGKQYASMPILLPPTIDEQQKIANCLSSLDQVLSAETEKLDLLKDHKKGLLQQLFPAEGETKPQFRFPEFEDDGDWETPLFSKYIKLYRGSSPRPINQFLTEDKTGVNWIKIGDTKNAKNNRLSKVSQKITLAGSKKSRKVVKGELILANSMSYGATYELEIEGCIYDGWFVLREYEESFDKQYLLQLLNSDILQKQYKRLAAGGIVQNISSEIVYNTNLPKPSKKEQEKIAKILSRADDLIAAQKAKTKSLKKHKKGLMQQLFPSINELAV